MPTQLELIDKLENKQYSKAEVTHLINSICFKIPPPKRLKIGDVYKYHNGTKPRPNVIIKIIEGMCYGIPLTSTQDFMVLCESTNSRFFTIEGKLTFFSVGMSVVTVEYAMDNFLGVFDDNKGLRLAKNELKLRLKKVL